MADIKNVVVIGGGVLGLEAAWEFKKARKNVNVLELAPQIMGRQLDEGASTMLTAISEGNGISIHTGVQIASIEGDEAVTGVKLSDGTVFPAELVVVSAGVRANAAIANAAGVAINRGVVVNAKMETNVEDIYACGDCAEFDGINYAIWPQALEQGKTAGANAAGDNLEYTTVSAGLSFNGMNTALYAIGDNGKNPNLIYRTVEFKDMGRKQYEKYYFLNNRLCGVILIGDTTKMAEVTTAIEEKKSFKEMFGR
jgi:NAD(P)H-nitrite reductase large subunit